MKVHLFKVYLQIPSQRTLLSYQAKIIVTYSLVSLDDPYISCIYSKIYKIKAFWNHVEKSSSRVRHISKAILV